MTDCRADDSRTWRAAALLGTTTAPREPLLTDWCDREQYPSCDSRARSVSPALASRRCKCLCHPRRPETTADDLPGQPPW